MGTEDVYGRRDHFAYLNQRQTLIHCLKTLSQRAQLKSCAENNNLANEKTNDAKEWPTSPSAVNSCS